MASYHQFKPLKKSKLNLMNKGTKNLFRYSSVLITLMLLFSLLAHSQTNTTSPYSRYGLGDLFNTYHGQFQGMGGSSIAIRNSDHINFYNPASYTSFDSLTFIFESGLHSRLSQYERNLSSRTNSEINFSYLAAGFRINKNWSASFGLLPYSSVGYQIETLNQILLPEGDFQIFSSAYTGAGGINQVYLGQSFRLQKNLSLGVNVNYLFGSINHSKIVNFLETNGSSSQQYFNTKYINKLIVSDFNLDLGLQYEQKINSKNSIILGLTYMPEQSLRAFQSQFIEKANSAGLVDTLLDTDSEIGSIDLPTKMGFGLSFYTSEKLLISAEYQMQDWSKARFLGVQDSLMNSNRLSMGIEYLPNARNILSTLARTKYRIGGYYSNTYLSFNNNQLTDYGISFGVGIPVSRSKSIINFNIVLGTKGTIESNLIRENYGLMSISLSLHDIWFLKRKFD